MLDKTLTLRPAGPDDAAHLAQLINIAGEGMPLIYWQDLAGPDGDAWAVGTERAARDAGSFSWRNATVVEAHGQIAAALIAYPIDSEASPEDYASLPPAFVPLQELEDKAVGSHYVNVLATYAQFRGRGLGTRLLQDARKAAGRRPMSIIVSDANTGARRLYERQGFEIRDSRPAPPDGPYAGHNWLLMVT